MDIQPQYLTLTRLLTARLFRIPRYQRAYSWQKKQRDDMFADIDALRNKPDAFHFMATVVGMRREQKTIVTDQYRVVEIVDGQQRITTLVILLRALQKAFNCSIPAENKLADELKELLVKQDDVSLILLQTNHDRSHYFADYISTGNVSHVDEAQTLADRELLRAIHECEEFIRNWDNRVELLRILKNQLTFIFHELDDEGAVYTVFEVLNNRGLHVSWLDRLKSKLMALAFERGQGNQDEQINELHNVWGSIYEAIGLRQGMNTEALRFAATLKSKSRPSETFSEETAVDKLIEMCGDDAARTTDISRWMLQVTKSFDEFLQSTQHSRAAVVDVAQARLLALAIILKGFSDDQKKELLDLWERTSFRIFGLCRKDKRTARGDYVRLAWDTLNKEGDGYEHALQGLKSISEGKEKEHSIEWAVAHLTNSNCYEGWEPELRYLLYRYEEHLATLKGQNFSNEQWNLIWEVSETDSIEHISPQSKKRQYVHRLGNLLLLPPKLNSTLKDKSPADKADEYIETGLLCAVEVAKTIKREGWGKEQVEQREKQILEWVESTWA